MIHFDPILTERIKSLEKQTAFNTGFAHVIREGAVKTYNQRFHRQCHFGVLFSHFVSLP